MQDFKKIDEEANTRPTDESLHVQYELLQSRITTHGNRVWQLPFAYVSFTALSSSIAFESKQTQYLSEFYLALCVIGVIISWCIIDAWRSYMRTAGVMNRIEKTLKLDGKTSAKWRHGLPHMVLCIFTALTTLGMATMVSQPDDWAYSLRPFLNGAG